MLAHSYCSSLWDLALQMGSGKTDMHGSERVLILSLTGSHVWLVCRAPCWAPLLRGST